MNWLNQHECLSHSAEAVVTVEPSVLIDLSIVKIEKKGESRKTNNYLYITTVKLGYNEGLGKLDFVRYNRFLL